MKEKKKKEEKESTPLFKQGEEAHASTTNVEG